MRYPPGPLNFNAYIGLTWRHLFLLWYDPLNYTLSLARNYGDLVFLRVFGYRAYQVNHPALIHEVLVSKAKQFAKLSGPLNAIRQFVGDGIITHEGEPWRRQRLLMQPGFGAAASHRLTSIALDEVSQMLERWAKCPEVRVHNEMNRLMVRSISRWLFDSPVERQDDELADAVTGLSETLREEMTNPFTLPDWIPLHSKWRKQRSSTLISTFIEERIAERRKKNELGDDLLGIFLRAGNDSKNGDLTNEQIKNELITLFFAGNHTAAACLTWTFYLLDKHPSILAALEREIANTHERSPADIDGRRAPPLVDWVIKESMRLYPPAWALFVRQAVSDTQIGDYVVPARSLIFIYPWVVHRDPRFFPEPERFVPERFTPERMEQLPAGAYIPFGLGPHSCIGGRMASSVMSEVLTAILQRCRLRLTANHPDPVLQPLISLRPRGDIRMRVESIGIPDGRPQMATC